MKKRDYKRRIKKGVSKVVKEDNTYFHKCGSMNLRSCLSDVYSENFMLRIKNKIAIFNTIDGITRC